jgi:hypothetical protein
LHFGVASHEARYDDQPPPPPDYTNSVDERRRYPLVLFHGSLRELAGTCLVRRTATGSFEVVDFEFEGLELQFGWDLADSRFYGSFTVDEFGRATLDEVLLVVPPAVPLP